MKNKLVLIFSLLLTSQCFCSTAEITDQDLELIKLFEQEIAQESKSGASKPEQLQKIEVEEKILV